MPETLKTPTTTAEVAYYLQSAPMSDAGAYTTALTDIPANVPDLVRALQGVSVHIFWAERYGLHLSEERQKEVQIRPVQPKLARILALDPRPLNCTRDPQTRLVCNCRDFSLLCATFLRSKGIPARARCGFGTYFMPNHYEDHWVVQYWQESTQRWVWLDAQIDDLQHQVLGMAWSTLDMPSGAFITGGQAWHLCRQGKANPEDFGIFEWHGWDFIKGNLFRDLLALNKFEVLPWDMWQALEPAYDQATQEQINWFDQVAEVTRHDTPDFAHVKALFSDHPEVHASAEWVK